MAASPVDAEAAAAAEAAAEAEAAQPQEPAPPASSSQRNRRKKRKTALHGDSQLLAWQGMTVTIPGSWNLASFGGDHVTGSLRADDEDGPRLELRWEQPKGPVDLPRSISNFLDQLARQAKKKREGFTAIDRPRLVTISRERKPQLVTFGWRGERGQDSPGRSPARSPAAGSQALAGHGWGLAWKCATCGRVVVAHVIGRGREKPEATQHVAGELLSSLECHGSGGWLAWSVFDLRLEVPEEFLLTRARLLTGRLELEWTRRVPPPPAGWGQRPERIGLTRVAAANVLLEDDTLEDWTKRSIVWPDKRRRFAAATETTVHEHTVHGHEALLLHGTARDPRRRLVWWLRNRVLHRATPPAEVRVWQCEASNKLFVLDTELSTTNAHVAGDVLDSLECHE